MRGFNAPAKCAGRTGFESLVSGKGPCSSVVQSVALTRRASEVRFFPGAQINVCDVVKRRVGFMADSGIKRGWNVYNFAHVIFLRQTCQRQWVIRILIRHARRHRCAVSTFVLTLSILPIIPGPHRLGIAGSTPIVATKIITS